MVKNGEIIAAAEEEKFTRQSQNSFPVNASMFCLQEAGIVIAQVDYVVFYDKPVLKFDRILASYIHTAPIGVSSFIQSIPLWLKSKLWIEDQMRKELGYQNAVLFTEHHQFDAASAFYPSPFKEAAIITVDGVGEWATTAIGAGTGNEIKLLRK